MNPSNLLKPKPTISEQDIAKHENDERGKQG